jgi:hypothetical protein
MFLQTNKISINNERKTIVILIFYLPKIVSLPTK